MKQIEQMIYGSIEVEVKWRMLPLQKQYTYIMVCFTVSNDQHSWYSYQFVLIPVVSNPRGVINPTIKKKRHENENKKNAVYVTDGINASPDELEVVEK
jgi:hypothetical protein